MAPNNFGIRAPYTRNNKKTPTKPSRGCLLAILINTVLWFTIGYFWQALFGN